MLLNHCSSILFNSQTRPYCPKTSNHLHIRKNIIDFTFTSVNHDVRRYPCSFPRRCHGPLPSSELPPDPQDDVRVHAATGGIGILEFFQGKSIFVTGATGFLGKVFVEKMVRSTLVDKIYLLIKAKDKEAAFHRLEHEIINSELFTNVTEKYGKSYVREKLMPVVGDICEPNLGMDYESIDILRKNVDVIIQSAANTNFNDRYDLVFDANVIAPQRVMRFAKSCYKLQLFTLISTAYVNEREFEGVVMEKPLINMGDVGDEISLLLNSPSLLTDVDAATNFFKQLGQQRARVLGLSTTYQLSKAMAEMAVNEIRGDVPLLIIRPSIVESCLREPHPGWIQGYKAADPVIISYGKGVLPAFYGNPRAPLDIIPVDLVANTMIAAIAKHAGKGVNTQPNVYHVASSVSNPITYLDFFEYQHQYFNTTAKLAKIEFFDDFEDYVKFTRDEIFRRNKAVGDQDRRIIRTCNARVEYAEQLAKTYEFAAFFKGRFDTGNAQKLIEEMSKEEQFHFEVDVKKIDWENYLKEIHIPGLKKYLNKRN